MEKMGPHDPDLANCLHNRSELFRAQASVCLGYDRNQPLVSVSFKHARIVTILSSRIGFLNTNFNKQNWVILRDGRLRVSRGCVG